MAVCTCLSQLKTEAGVCDTLSNYHQQQTEDKAPNTATKQQSEDSKDEQCLACFHALCLLSNHVSLNSSYIWTD